MKSYLLLFLGALTFSVNAQVNLLSISPANGTTNVPQSTTISVVFDTPIDTSKGFDFFGNFFTNAFDITAKWYSEDLKTVNLGVNLDADKNYYFLVNSVKGVGETTLLNPTVIYFTTSSSLVGSLVSGIVSAPANSGVELNNTVVVLSSTPINNGDPMLETGAFTNSQGEFAIPYVKDGVYYPIAVNDANKNGELNPGEGDAFVFFDAITVSGNYTGLDMLLQIPDPITLFEATQQANNIVAQEFSGNVFLKRISARQVNPEGKTTRWEFDYISDSLNIMIYVEIDVFGNYIDSFTDEWNYQNCLKMETIQLPNDLNALATFMHTAETSGGASFRAQVKPSNFELDVELMLADHRYSNWSYQNPDTSKHISWLVSYRWWEESQNEWSLDSELLYWGDFQTGALIVTDVQHEDLVVPNKYSLGQNYPNPFNPSTKIKFGLPKESKVTLVVFNILGQEVAQLVNQQLKAGYHEVEFNSSSYSSGIYFYRIQARDYVETKKMIYLK